MIAQKHIDEQAADSKHWFLATPIRCQVFYAIISI
jgi:hypothetical protein